MNLIKSARQGQSKSARLALVGPLLFVLAPDLARPQEQEEDPSVQESETVRRYREVAEKQNRPIDHYNLGTALLGEGQVGEAQYPLQESLGSERATVREQGYYNYGLSTALDGRSAESDPNAQRAGLEAARDAFRQVLRDRPDHEDARWNLELIELWLEEEETDGRSDAGGQGDSPQGSGSGAAQAGGAGDMQMLSLEQATALLEQAGEAESALRDRVMGRNRFQEPVVEKNW
jgi:hypothetical protein